MGQEPALEGRVTRCLDPLYPPQHTHTLFAPKGMGMKYFSAIIEMVPFAS